jgi:hypothetical protein
MKFEVECFRASSYSHPALVFSLAQLFYATLLLPSPQLLQGKEYLHNLSLRSRREGECRCEVLVSIVAFLNLVLNSIACLCLVPARICTLPKINFAPSKSPTSIPPL